MAQFSTRGLFGPRFILVLISIVMGFFLLLLIITKLDFIPKIGLNPELVNPKTPAAQVNSDALFRLKKAANRFLKKGETDKAVPVLKEIYKLECELIGPKNKETVETLGILAGQTVLMEKYDEALPLVWQLYKIKEKTLGPTHSDTLDALQNLAQVYHLKGKYEKAVGFFKVVYKQQKIQLGAENVETVRVLHLMGMSLWKVEPKTPEKTERILRYFRQVHKVYARVLGGQNDKTLSVLLETGRFLVALERLHEAIPLLRTVMKAKEKTPQSQLYEAAEDSLGSALRQLGRTEEARQVHKTARQIKIKRGEETHEYASKIQAQGKFTPEVEDQIAAVLNLARVAVAEENYEKALQKLEQLDSIVENDHPKRKDVLQSLVEVHDGLGNYNKAFDLSIELFHLVRKQFQDGNSDYYDKVANTWKCVCRTYFKIAEEHPKETEQFFGPRFKEVAEIFVNTMEPEFKKRDEQNPRILRIMAKSAWFCGKSEIALSTVSKLIPILERARDLGPKLTEKEMQTITEEINNYKMILEQQTEQSSEYRKIHKPPSHMYKYEL